jgi:hypothetical protein
MSRTMLWLFFLADVAGVLWAVRVLVREARRQLAWWRTGRHAHGTPMLELPEDVVVIPAARTFRQDVADETAVEPDAVPPLRLIG